MTEFAYPSPASACDALIERLARVGTERVDLADAAGRVLAESIAADRDSPAADVSAMDGFALRHADLRLGRLPIVGTVDMGQAPPRLGPQTTIRIVTGGGVPAGADTVVRREDVDEQPGAIAFDPALAETVAVGANIRVVGENLRAGELAAAEGVVLTPPAIAALASFGKTRPLVRRRVHVSIINTGDEVLPASASPSVWQLRDSNGPVLGAMLGGCPWIELIDITSCSDDRGSIEQALSGALDASDAVLLTGGVSMGDKDFVPGAITSVGGEIIFHRLPQKPGKPLLGAVGPKGQCVLGFPGNPVSVMVTARRIGEPALSAIGGRPPSMPISVRIDKPDIAPSKLWVYRLARRLGMGEVELVRGKGSGDTASAARSDGFVEIPPNDDARGELALYPWAWS